MRRVQGFVLVMMIGLAHALDKEVRPDTEVTPKGESTQQAQRPLDSLGSLKLLPEMPNDIKIENDGSIFYDNEKQTVLYTGDPAVKMVTDKGTEIYAKTALVDLNKKFIVLKGDVSIYQGPSLTRGTEAIYYWEKKDLKTKSLVTKVDSFLLESGKFQMVEDEAGHICYEGVDSGVSLQDIDKPDSWMRADRIRLYPEDSVEFRGMTVYGWGLPIFYFPYFSHSLNPRLGYLPVPGSRSIWGAFLNNEYGFIIGKKRIESGVPTGEYLGTARVNYMMRRGVGLGLDIENVDKERNWPMFKGLSLFYINDMEAGIQVEGITRQFDDPNRWRVTLQQRWELNEPHSDRWNWRVDTNLNILSDKYVLVDFFPRIVTNEQRPDNMLALTGVGENTVLTTMLRTDLNDFYLTDSRLPEVTWDRVRGILGSTPLVYEGTFSAGILRQNMPEDSLFGIRSMLRQLPANDPRRAELESLINSDSYMRMNTYHELAMTKKVGDFLTITPKFGLGYTGYFDVENEKDFDRTLAFGGVNIDTKFTGDFSDYQNVFLGLNGLKHVLQPYMNYSVVQADSLPMSYPHVDMWSMTTNPIPLSLGRFTAIDDLSSWNMVRFGMRNYLLTQRDGGSHQWFVWDVFMDGYFNCPEFIEDNRFSNVYSYASWSPVPWVNLYWMSQTPVVSEGSGFTENNIGVRFMVNRWLELNVSNWNLNGHSILDDSNMISGGFNIRIDDSSSFAAMYRFEMNDSTLERQEYLYYRNLGSWVLGVGYYANYNRIQYDRGVMMSFTLKDFPQTAFPFRIF